MSTHKWLLSIGVQCLVSPQIRLDFGTTNKLVAPAGGLCTSCRNKQQPTSKWIILWGFFRDLRGCIASCEVLSRISVDGAHLVRFCPGFPGMRPILWGFVQGFRGWGSSCDVLSGILNNCVGNCSGFQMYAANMFRSSVVRSEFV